MFGLRLRQCSKVRDYPCNSGAMSGIALTVAVALNALQSGCAESKRYGARRMPPPYVPRIHQPRYLGDQGRPRSDRSALRWLRRSQTRRHYSDRYFMITNTALYPYSAVLFCYRSLIGRDTAQQFPAFLPQIQWRSDRSSRHLDYQAMPQRSSTPATHRITARCAGPSRPSAPNKPPQSAGPHQNKPRVRSLAASERRPRCARPRLTWPASGTLLKTGLCALYQFESASPSKPDVGRGALKAVRSPPARFLRKAWAR
jgi:hypothetical protein